VHAADHRDLRPAAALRQQRVEVPGGDANGEPVAAEQHHPVEREVDAVAAPGDDDRAGEIPPPLRRVELDDRNDPAQVRVPHDAGPERRVARRAPRPRRIDRRGHDVHEALGRGVQGAGQPGTRSADSRDDRGPVARHPLEQHRTLAGLRQASGQGRPRGSRPGDPFEQAGPVTGRKVGSQVGRHRGDAARVRDGSPPRLARLTRPPALG
jgi:hypothetical protein